MFPHEAVQNCLRSTMESTLGKTQLRCSMCSYITRMDFSNTNTGRDKHSVDVFVVSPDL